MPTTARPIRFYHHGRIVEVSDAPATRTVLQWLREDARCTGTKEGCAEGDCGACTVVLGHLGPDGALQLQPINACLRLLPTLDGHALFTVEDLQPPCAVLHPVQQALVDGHGSQCGFCTPGIVMSLWALWQRQRGAGTVPTRQQIADTLAGNLCRCTGYRPILDAGESAFKRPGAPLDAAPVVAALQTLAQDPPLAYRNAYWAPRSADDFAALRLQRPGARVLAGATDLALQVTKQLRELPELIAIGEVRELQGIAIVDGALHIGAAASLEAAWQALAQSWPSLRELWLRFASPPIRHAGTMVGNVANGSPIGDSAPVLMALDSHLRLRRGEAVRTLKVSEFYVDYMRNRLEPGEFVQTLVVPLPRPGQVLRAYKISKRFDCDISAVCAAFALEFDAAHQVRSARLAFGGMAATVRRASRAEAALLGRPWSEAPLQDAMDALGSDFTPLSDQRASASYRLQVAQNLLRRCWLETRPDDPLPATALSVWAREGSA